MHSLGRTFSYSAAVPFNCAGAQPLSSEKCMTSGSPASLQPNPSLLPPAHGVPVTVQQGCAAAPDDAHASARLQCLLQSGAYNNGAWGPIYPSNSASNNNNTGAVGTGYNQVGNVPAASHCNYWVALPVLPHKQSAGGNSRWLSSY